MNKFFIPILIFLVIIFCLYKNNNLTNNNIKNNINNNIKNNIKNNNINTYENFASYSLQNYELNDIETIKGEIFDIKYKNYIDLLKSYYGDAGNLLKDHAGLSIRPINNLYEDSILDCSMINVINNYHKTNLYNNIYNQNSHLSNFLLFINPSHKMQIEFTNNDEMMENVNKNSKRISYRIKNITPGIENSNIFKKDVVFNLFEKDKKYYSEEQLNDINNFALDLSNGKNFLESGKYNLNFELPTRLSGNYFSTTINSNIITSFLYLLPGNYEIDLILESKNLLEDDDILNFTSLRFVDFDSEYFSITDEPEKFTKGEISSKNLLVDINIYKILLNKMLISISKNDVVDNGGNDLEIKLDDKLNHKICIYNKKDNKHSKKIRDVITYVIYILKSELNKYLNENDADYEKTVNSENNILIVNDLLDIYFSELNIESFKEYRDEMKKILDNDKEIKDKYLTDKHITTRKNLLDLVEKMNTLFKLKPYTDDEIKNNLEAILKKVKENENKIVVEAYNTYTKKYKINVKADPIPDPNYIPEKELEYLEIKPRQILKSIQDDLRLALNQRGNKKLDNYLSKETITNLKRIDAISKLEDVDQTKEREGNKKLKEIIMNVLDKIKSGDYTLVSKFLEYDIKNSYQYPNEIIEEFISKEELMKRHPIKYTRGQKEAENNSSKTIEIKNRNKNKMDSIYKRLDMIRNRSNNNKIDFDIDDEEKLSNIVSKGMNSVRRKDDIIEGFLPHKHTKEGQIKWNIDPELDNEQWLKKNYNTVGDYQFIPKENKEQMLKSYDNMEKNIKDTIAFVSETYNNYDERINIYEAEKQKKINEAQNNLNTRDYERERIEFENREKEQEEKSKIINQKIEELDKITNRVSMSDSFKSISSYGDGQTLSITNVNNNIYTIKANRGCLSLGENNLLNSAVCDGNDKQQFLITNIKNKDEYNTHLKNPVDDYAEVFYPFSIVKTKGNKNQCLSMKGSSLGIHDCRDTVYQRWDTKKLEKECRGDYSS